MNRPVIRNTLFLVLSILGAVIAATVLMILVYLIPTDRMKQNVASSAEIIINEKDAYFWAPAEMNSRLDGFADAVILNTAIYDGSEGVVEKAMMNYRLTHEEGWMSQSLYEVLTGNTSELHPYDYSRYWNGYLTVVKPLLLVFTYSQIRIFRMFLQLTLIFLIAIEIYKRSGSKSALAFFFTMLVINPVSTAMSLQFAHVMNVTLWSLLAMFKFGAFDKTKIWKFLLWAGILTSFFDQMSYPVVCLGIPLIIYLNMSSEDTKTKFISIITGSASWGIGYGGMWVGKWIVAELLVHKGTMSNAMGQAFFRVAGGFEQVDGALSDSYFDILLDDMVSIGIVPLMIFTVFVIILMIMIWKKRSGLNGTKDLSFLLPLIVGLYPFVWVAAVQSHAAVHLYLTYRNFAITLFAVLSVLISALALADRKQGT